MTVSIHAIGGYNEVGRNMTLVTIDKDSVIMDMGIYLEKFVPIQEAAPETMHRELLIHEGAIPDDDVVGNKKKVKAILLSHGHLDHIGAVSWLMENYHCPIVGSPYTIEILRGLIKDSKIKSKNKLIPLSPNSSYKISKDLTVELINVTHSIPQTQIIALHTSYGTIVYVNDYKFDNNPIVGKKSNKRRLRELGNKDVLALIVDSTNAELEGKTPSESVAREMLRDVMLGTENQGQGLILTTFSSHIARLKSAYDFARELDRKVVFLGRSLQKYITAAEKLGFVSFKKAQIAGSIGRSKSLLKEINRNRGKYLLVVTGNQGEPNAALTTIADNGLPFQIMPEDFVIFSCKTIPTPTIIANRKVLEQKLKNKRARIFKDIHVSGHGGREDHRDLIRLLAPTHIIPSHGDMNKLAAFADLATAMGYKLGESVHLLQNGQEVKLL